MEIDESKFVKRKYGKGKRKVCKDWVLGGIGHETGECFMRIVKNRSKVTLLSIIKEYVLPKTTIITDCYVSYHMTCKIWKVWNTCTTLLTTVIRSKILSPAHIQTRLKACGHIAKGTCQNLVCTNNFWMGICFYSFSSAYLNSTSLMAT